MKRSLLVSAVTLSLAGAGYLMVTSNSEVTSSYEERTTMSFTKKAQSWARAQEYIKMFIANPNTGEIDSRVVAKARQQAESLKAYRASIGMEWAERGPDNIGGRTRALIVDNTDTTGNTVLTGGVSGGLYRSTNGGATWIPIDNMSPAPAISCIAQGTNGTIYVGTGSSFESHRGDGNSGQKGMGMYKSTDGITFELLSSTVPSTISTDDDWAVINRIAVDPTNDDRLWAACYNQGLMLSEDGGQTWNVAATNTVGIPIPKITEVQVADDGTVLFGTDGAVWYSEDGSVGSFEASKAVMGSSLPYGKRVAIKFAPSNNDTVWAAATTDINPPFGQYELTGLYRSTDRGHTWSLAQGPVTGIWDETSGLFNSQGYYDLALGVNPKDARIAYVGGVQIWRFDGALTRIAMEGSGGSDFYVHADKHEVVFDPFNSNKMFVCSDGGIGISYDAGVTWYEANKGYQTTQYYDVAAHPDGRIMGGTQDNGTIEVTGEMSEDGLSIGNQGYSILGGDGYGCDYSTITEIQFASSYDESYNRGLAEGGLATMCSSNGNGPSCSAPNNSRFYSQMRLWESANDATSRDSIVFDNTNEPQAILKGDGTTKSYSFDIIFVYPEAQLVEGSIQVYAGNQLVTDSGMDGVLVGDGNGSIVYTGANKGHLEVEFLNPPAGTETVWVEFETKYDSGDQITLQSNTSQLPVPYTLPLNVNPGDVFKVVDPIQSLLAVGISANASGVALTRNALKLEVVGDDLDWIDIELGGGYVSTFEFTPDGNHLFVGTGFGDGTSIYRISGLNKLYTNDDIDSITVTSLGNLQNSVTGIAIDPNDPNNVIATTGAYDDNNGHVWRCTDALTASGNGSFENIQSNLPYMPCFSAVLMVEKPGYCLIGTDMGVYGTDDIFATNVTWTDENGSTMAHTPVHAMRQIALGYGPSMGNQGKVILGTHGRGFWESTTGTGIGDFSEGDWNNAEFISELNVYPNPMSTTGTVTFDLAKDARATVQIYDINGRMVKPVANDQFNSGTNKVDFNVDELGRGTYFLIVDSQENQKVAKFVTL